VIVHENLFGGRLTDEASVLAGSIRLFAVGLPGRGKTRLYEPIHGSAPVHRGRGIANPYGTIPASRLMLRTRSGWKRKRGPSSGRSTRRFDRGALPADLPRGQRAASTVEAGDAVLAALQET